MLIAPSPRRCFCRLVTFAAFAVLDTIALAQSASGPDLEEVARQGAATASRLAGESLAWTSVFEVPNGDATVEVLTTIANGIRDWTVSIRHGDQSQKLVRIVERNGYWYVFHDGQVRKYRPYEAPLPLPSTYLFLAKSGLPLVVDPATLSTAKFESLQEKVASYRAPLPESARQQLRQSLAAFDQVKQQNPNRLTAEHTRNIVHMRDMLDRGEVIQVDTSTGVMLASGTIGNRRWVKDLRRLAESDVANPSAELAAAVDCTHPLTDGAESLDDLLMFGHASAWAPGGPKVDTDAVIINIRSGEIRRVAYPMGGTLTGCFAKDRRSVFISGLVLGTADLGIFQVDLAKGEAQSIAAKGLTGVTMFPTLSPDGKFLAVVNRSGQDTNILNSQVCVIDLSAEAVSKVGQPIDTAFLSWLPDQSGLMLVTREHRDNNARSKSTIARMDLAGRITPIRAGTFPIVLPEQNRILFLNEADDLWRTCDMTGQTETLVGDGLKGFGFPALSPDGTRLLMMRFAKATGPRPYFVDLATGKATPLEVGPGLWVLPAWR